MTSIHHVDFYCFICFHSLKQKTNVNRIKEYVNINIVTPSEDTKILESDQNQKSNTALFIINADRQCLIGKIDVCKNNPENSSTTRVCEHIPSGFSMFLLSLKSIKSKHDCNWTRTHSHLVRKRTLNHLAKLTK